MVAVDTPHLFVT